ncbi:MAG: AbrB/MazE/SpoVT family DNA-binding domain-containing protein [Candidatus Bipolaricaulota bacterium]|nr:AbrB/MazE/SpoVT family DNA-binding domain-containing protein [Candidatus Bipolaricaulota bacterium]
MTSVKIVRLGRKGQMVLPKEVREALGLEEGDSVIIALEEKGQALLATPERYAALTRGMLRGTWGQTQQEIERYLQRERASWEETKD